jgi:hypothetical protein
MAGCTGEASDVSDDGAPNSLTSRLVDLIVAGDPAVSTHWGTQEMHVRDPDGRIWSLQAPPKVQQ